ncbi:MAG TPA: hypothetical protein VFO79_04050, partial [Xanthomonadales bacterium]|nr:hypothetical protein [Xanthomonadales bacterium]
MSRRFLALLVLAATLVSPPDPALAQSRYVNWENHPVHGLDLSPDGRVLAVAHTADSRVQLFDVSLGFAVPLGSVAVGLDPVSVRFRDAGTLWVANHVSDTVSVVDVANRSVTATIPTADEPADIVFAGNPRRAYVSASQANLVQVFDAASPGAPLASIAIDAEDPRALAASPDGRTVYAAIFESGNGSTILAGGTATTTFPPNVVPRAESPYGGQNPPPNDGTAFTPALSPDAANPPAGGIIVKKSPDGRWRDGNARDWTAFVSGPDAARYGRIPGWDLVDRDVAVIDTATNAVVRYDGGGLNIVMALAVQPDGRVTTVGTNARNEVRFEPNLRARYVSVDFASHPGGAVQDLNPQLAGAGPTVADELRTQSLGDPRAIAWRADGSRGYVAGMGSNNVVVVSRSGAREPVAPISVGQGPAALALDEARGVLWVWNHFDASLSRVALDTLAETDRIALHTPVPSSIREGRPFLYDTHRTSGTGHVSCASCHVDARMDRLAWDLGNPAGATAPFNQNCATDRVGPDCGAFHPVKGPMLTMTMQDVIGKEPLHWRGDRAGIEGFHPTYVGLQGRSASITAEEMAAMKRFLATVVYPPNPFRRADNTLPTDLPLPGHESTGRFAAAGTPLPNGNAQRGLELFRTGRQSVTPGAPDNCSVCHSLPTGFGPNGSITAIDGTRLGGSVLPPGPNGENHLAIVGNATVTDRPFKVASLRNLYERTGFDMRSTRSRAGFGFLHDGTVDSLARYMGLDAFLPRSEQDIADFVALLLAFSGSDLVTANAQHGAVGPASNDTHASAGRQATAAAGDTAAAAALAALASSPRLELVARVPDGVRSVGWLQRADGTFTSDNGANAATLDATLASLAPSARATFTLVPEGTGERIALDRDGDGVRDGPALAQGSRPSDAASSTLSPAAGLWFNPARSGHVMDIERAGEVLASTWYTYLPDGSPVWYQAVARFEGSRWTAPLNRYSIAADGSRPGEVVGELTL